jgi:hypothetical protein
MFEELSGSEETSLQLESTCLVFKSYRDLRRLQL